MIIDQVDLASDYLNSFYDLTFVPTCYFDGGQQVLVGGYSSQAYYTSRINTCAQREVADLDLSIETTWLGEASLEITVNLTCNQFTNTPPDDPIEPEGIDEGFIETEYLFTTSAIDPDGDQLYYMWDWGNGEMSDWLGPYNSGETVDASHIWTVHGTFDVSVKAKDELDDESEWSPVASVKIAVPGDANGDGDCNVADAVYIIGYVFKEGAAPDPLIAGDANCDGQCNVADAVYIITYVFKDGAPPGCP
jgi:hypothetical protein